MNLRSQLLLKPRDLGANIFHLGSHFRRRADAFGRRTILQLVQAAGVTLQQAPHVLTIAGRAGAGCVALPRAGAARPNSTARATHSRLAAVLDPAAAARRAHHLLDSAADVLGAHLAAADHTTFSGLDR